MKAVELREMPLDELRLRERELAEELARLRIQLAVKRLDNPLKVRVTRRELARVKTVIAEKAQETTAGSRAAAPPPEAPAGS
jgi:large subunit ribosomal protein L29